MKQSKYTSRSRKRIYLNLMICETRRSTRNKTVFPYCRAEPTPGMKKKVPYFLYFGVSRWSGHSGKREPHPAGSRTRWMFLLTGNCSEGLFNRPSLESVCYEAELFRLSRCSLFTFETDAVGISFSFQVLCLIMYDFVINILFRLYVFDFHCIDTIRRRAKVHTKTHASQTNPPGKETIGRRTLERLHNQKWHKMKSTKLGV